MLYEVITIQDDDSENIFSLLSANLEDLSELFIVSVVEVLKGNPDVSVITSYSIHYTKLYE